MLHTRWSRRWEDYQAGYETNQNKTRTNCKSWIQGIIRIIWDHHHQRWMQRSKILRGEDQGAGRRGLHARVQALYGMKSQLPHQYHFLFQLEDQQRLAQGNKSLRDWLRMTEQILSRAFHRINRRKKKTTGLEQWIGLKCKRRRRRVTGMERRMGWESRRKQ